MSDDLEWDGLVLRMTASLIFILICAISGYLLGYFGLRKEYAVLFACISMIVLVATVVVRVMIFVVQRGDDHNRMRDHFMLTSFLRDPNSEFAFERSYNEADKYMKEFSQNKPSCLEEIKSMALNVALTSVALVFVVFFGYAKATGIPFLQLWVR
jgi:hypothetical protein